MFALQVTDIFTISGRGVVLTGTIEKGRVYAGSRIELCTPVKRLAAAVSGVERNRQIVSSAGEGENVALLIRGVEMEDLPGALEPGDVPGTWRVTKLRIESAPKKWWEFWI